MSRKTLRHLDEARDTLVSNLAEQWHSLDLDRALIIEDAFGRFSLGCWGSRASEAAIRELLASLEPFGASLFWAPPPDQFDPLELERSWEESASVDFAAARGISTLRTCVRHRMLPAWQQCRSAPLWDLSADDSCPIVSFSHLKVGWVELLRSRPSLFTKFVAASTSSSSILDLDAPGLGSILPVQADAPYGVVDYLLESTIVTDKLDLLDYSARVDLRNVATEGTLRAFTAGRLDRHYLGKLARLDFEQPEDRNQHPLDGLMTTIREQLRPDLILLDSRTGFSETAGVILSGLGHLHVLLGVQSQQSWEGLTYAIRRLGAERLDRGHAQADIQLVHGMVPQLPKDQLLDLTQRFAEQAEDVFRDNFFAEPDGLASDDVWYLDDFASEPAPHRAHQLSYVPALAQSVTVDDLISTLDANHGGYTQFCDALFRRLTLPGNP
ncbi:MAG: hypothetical protein QM784_13800 [Polyangiaceae bacterium]